MIKNVALILVAVALWSGCSKGPGEGGRASIKGKLFAVNYNNSYVAIDSGYVGAINTYIKYGDMEGIADNTDTDPNGIFKFNYLRPGKYSIIVYSKKLVNNVLDSAIIKTVEIESRNQELDLGTIRINTFKN